MAKKPGWCVVIGRRCGALRSFVPVGGCSHHGCGGRVVHAAVALSSSRISCLCCSWAIVYCSRFCGGAILVDGG